MAGNNRGWDESKSPQWRYLLGKESELRRATKRIFRGEDGEDTMNGGEIKRNKQSVRASHKKMRKDRNHVPKSSDLGLTKKGRKIVYSASPGHNNNNNNNK